MIPQSEEKKGWRIPIIVALAIGLLLFGLPVALWVLLDKSHALWLGFVGIFIGFVMMVRFVAWAANADHVKSVPRSLLYRAR
ncbi:MAG: hypothetical protein Q7S16_04575 [bacterium]|nr:hypothetical protein [bacterium]